MKRLIAMLVTAMAVLLMIPAPLHAEEIPSPLKVYVSILPQSYFVERIGGGHVDVQVLVGPGRSPETYEPTPKVMVSLSEADVYFTIGVPFEQNLTTKIRQVIPNVNIVMTGAKETGHSDHAEPETYHNHDHGIDPHVWLDPLQVKDQADIIASSLAATAPQWADIFETNKLSFQADLDSLNATIAKKLAPYAGRRFYVFHPAFGHFARRYNLEQVAIEIEGKEPSGKHLANLIEKARADGATTIFVQQQFSHHAAEAIAREIGAEIVELNALSADYFNNMNEIASHMAAAFAKGETQ